LLLNKTKKPKLNYSKSRRKPNLKINRKKEATPRTKDLKEQQPQRKRRKRRKRKTTRKRKKLQPPKLYLTTFLLLLISPLRNLMLQLKQMKGSDSLVGGKIPLSTNSRTINSTVILKTKFNNIKFQESKHKN